MIETRSFSRGPKIPQSLIEECRELNRRFYRFKDRRIKDRRTRGGKRYAVEYARLLREQRPDLADLIWNLEWDREPVAMQFTSKVFGK